MNLIDYIVNVFVMADDFCKTYFPDRSLRASGPLPKQTIRTLMGKRRLIETVAGQLEQRFRIKTTFVRDLWHLLYYDNS